MELTQIKGGQAEVAESSRLAWPGRGTFEGECCAGVGEPLNIGSRLPLMSESWRDSNISGRCIGRMSGNLRRQGAVL